MSLYKLTAFESCSITKLNTWEPLPIYHFHRLDNWPAKHSILLVSCCYPAAAEDYCVTKPTIALLFNCHRKWSLLSYVVYSNCTIFIHRWSLNLIVFVWVQLSMVAKWVKVGRDPLQASHASTHVYNTSTHTHMKEDGRKPQDTIPNRCCKFPSFLYNQIKTLWGNQLCTCQDGRQWKTLIPAPLTYYYIILGACSSRTK